MITFNSSGERESLNSCYKRKEDCRVELPNCELDLYHLPVKTGSVVLVSVTNTDNWHIMLDELHLIELQLKGWGADTVVYNGIL